MREEKEINIFYTLNSLKSCISCLEKKEMKILQKSCRHLICFIQQGIVFSAYLEPEMAVFTKR